MTVARGREGAAAAALLEAARVPPDGVLFVHAAFHGLGAQGYRAEAFIEGLLAYTHLGTLAMPAMSWRVVTPANPEFDEISTPSHVGVLAETFRTGYAQRRSIHPTHSVAAAGRHSSMLLSGHHLDDTPCSINSPYGRAAGENAHILMLGIGLERVTAIHHAEETIAINTYIAPPEAAETYQCRDREGRTHVVRLRRHLRLNRNFPQFEAPLEAMGKLRRGNLDGTVWMAVAQRDLLAVVVEALERDPQAIIAPPGAPVIP